MAERTFRAMGTRGHVIVCADGAVDELAGLAIRRVELLEAAWSRFRPASELNRLNARTGTGPVAVSADTLTLVDHMIRSWRASEGRFDPTVLDVIVALGYDADFATIAARSQDAKDPADLAFLTTPGMSGVRLDPSASTVSLPRGVGLDPGAIGKGLAADIVVGELLAAGAAGVLVNLGGDIAVAGVAPDAGQPWRIGIEDERRPTGDPGRVIRLWEVPAGTQAGIATSTTLRRRWAGGRRHHIIDPRTGTMSASDLVQVTIGAGRAWQAEVAATTALLMGAQAARDWLDTDDTRALLLTAHSVIDPSRRGAHVG